MVSLLMLSACGPISPERAADRCEERARAAQAPEIGVTLGANTSNGPFARGSIGVSTDYIKGTDPNALYESCVLRLTGEPPIRSPRLRDIRQ